MRSVRTLLFALGSVATLGMSLAGCGSTTPERAGLQTIDGGRQITVPVLWSDPSRAIGGVEPAVVKVGDGSATNFSSDLRDLEAKGAGAAWTAASASAAAVGALYSGRDPSDIDVSFTVSGPIDGPSAGALLTVAAGTEGKTTSVMYWAFARAPRTRKFV